MDIRFCDERGPDGFSWIVDEPATRTSHALVADGRVWLVDPVRFEPALARARDLGEAAGVLQLLDRHNRDCAAIAAELQVPHLIAPYTVAGSPFRAIALKRSKRWRETTLWWEATRTLVVAEAIGTNRFYTGDDRVAGVHLLLRLSPPRDALGGFKPEHLLVGHGEGLHGSAATTALRDALAHAKSGLPRMLVRIPAYVVDAIRRRRAS